MNRTAAALQMVVTAPLATPRSEVPRPCHQPWGEGWAGSAAPLVAAKDQEARPDPMTHLGNKKRPPRGDFSLLQRKPAVITRRPGLIPYVSRSQTSAAVHPLRDGRWRANRNSRRHNTGVSCKNTFVGVWSQSNHTTCSHSQTSKRISRCR